MSLVGIDLFAGAGGMSLGAIQAGIRVALAVEVNPHAAATYRLNHTQTSVHCCDIRKVSAQELRGSYRRAEGTILFGGPPCQGFSCSNQRTRNAANANNWLYLEFVRIARLCKPDWVLFENVKGIRDTEKGLFLADLVDRLSGLGYAITWGILDSADFGAPQHRERLFVIGSRHNIYLDLPKPQGPRIPVSDALFDLPPLPNGASISWMPYKCAPKSHYARALRGKLRRSPNHLVTCSADRVIQRYRSIPCGHNWTSIPRSLMTNYRSDSEPHTGLYRRLREDRPSVVIGNYRKNMLIHPIEHRGLSVREAARLQSFPDFYEFTGSIGFQQQQVGNAVPPSLAHAVFEHVVAQA